MKKSNTSLDSTGSRGSGFFSRVAKSRKSGGSLPVPMHQRTVSSPVPLIETTSPDAMSINHKRYPSSIDHRAIDAPDRFSFKGDNKKLSLDSHLSVEKSPKRTSSDTSDKHSKKNFSSEKLITKRSLDEIRMPTSPADKAFVLNTPETPKTPNLTATPELLAALLKGSSEKLLNEQNHSKKHQSRNSSNTNSMSLPTAVLNSLNSLVSLTARLSLLTANTFPLKRFAPKPEQSSISTIKTSTKIHSKRQTHLHNSTRSDSTTSADLFCLTKPERLFYGK